MRFKHLREGFGVAETLYFVSLVLLFAFNLLHQINVGINIYKMSYATLPYIICAVMLLMYDKKYTFSAILLYIAITTTIDPANISDISGSIFFIYSFHQIKKRWYGVTIVIVSIVALTIKSIVMGDTIPGTLAMVLAFIIVYAIYYFTIYNDTKRPSFIRFKELTKEENRILNYMADGLSQKEAGYELGYDKFRTNFIVKQIRKKTGYDSLYEILYRAGLKNHSTSGHNK